MIFTGDKGVDRAITAVRAWYGRSLPKRLDHDSFVDFCVRSREFARAIAPDAVLRVDFHAQCAYTDGRSLYLPLTYFVKDFYRAIGIGPDVEVEAAIALVNGSQIHEALHVLLSECDMRLFARLDNEARALFDKYGAFATVLNLVEDIYIEEYARQHFTGLSEFIQAKNDVLLGSLVAPLAWKRLADEPSLDNLLSCLVLRKNPALDGDPNWDAWRHLTDVLDRVKSDHKKYAHKRERLLLAVELFKLLLDQRGEDGEPMPRSEEFKEGSASQDRYIDGHDGMRSDNQLLQQLIQALSGAMAEAVGEDDGKGDENGNNVFQTPNIGLSYREAEEFRGRLESAFNVKLPRSNDEVDLSKIPAPHVITVDQSLYRFGSLEDDHEFQRLGSYLRYARAVKKSTGKLRDSGQRLVTRQLYRITTDAKIMSNMDSFKAARREPEVIILIDISGSTELSCGSRPGESLLKSELRASMSAFDSLMRAGIPVAVYAHTTTDRQSKLRPFCPVIYGVAAFRMSLHGGSERTTTNFRKHFASMLSVDHSQNIDGVAIDYCLRQFSSRPGAKILLVLSDGKPSGGPYYAGEKGCRHTKSVVDAARKNGKHVFALSLTHEVMGTNNAIYGEEFNLPAYGALLNQSMQRIVSAIALG